ncbi:MAG: hypothetical protein AMXMBFR64_34720 [Myxococcales bacterium]
MKLEPTGVPMVGSRSEVAMDRVEAAARGAESREDLEHVAKEFEALMLTKLVESMRATVPKSDLWAGGSSQGMYDGMMDDALGHHLANSGGLGVAKELMRSWGRGTGSGEMGGGGIGELRQVEPSRGRSERGERLPPDELSRILQASRDLGGRDDGETPLSELPPPTRDEWLFSPQAEQVLRALISNDPASPGGSDDGL